jgi:hypothetical protein
MVLGLEAPAFAATPTITGVSPTSGPAGCVVVLTGTNFNNPNVVDVEFGGVNAAGFTIQSGTELWATVPAAAPVGPTTVTVNNGDVTEGVFAFTVTDPLVSPGGCAPTVTSYTPTCGASGTEVVIAGTNLLAADDGTGGDVFFAPYGAAQLATHSNAATETPSSLTVFVPATAADGPIRVETFNSTIGSGAALGSTIFEVPPPDCTPTTGNNHARAISFKITKAGRASGVVKSTEDPAFTECVAAVPVKIQRKKGGAWKTVGKTVTDDAGAYVKKVKNPKGTQKFRALAPKVSLGDPVTDVCLKARSAVRKK